MQTIHSELQSLGATLLVASPERLHFNRFVKWSSHLSFDLLRDAHNRVASQFGIAYTLPPELRSTYRDYDIDLEVVNGDPHWMLPLPARYVIDEAGIIRYAALSPDYTSRPDPSDTLDAVRGLAV